MKLDPAGYLRTSAEVTTELRALGLAPVLVGGMALVILGSRRVTNDFDFVIAHPGAHLDRVLQILYARGLELVSRLDEAGNAAATIDNRTVAGTRLRIDAPASAAFYNHETGLRIDLLFDFPIEAGSLAERANRMKIQSHVFAVASDEDLLTLKRIAAAARSAPGDAEDIAFLEARLRTAPHRAPST